MTKGKSFTIVTGFLFSFSILFEIHDFWTPSNKFV